MNFRDFQNMRLAIKVNGFTTWQLILLYSEIAGRICDFEEFKDMHKEISDIEELMVESLDKHEEARYVYEPDPADLHKRVTEDV